VVEIVLLMLILKIPVLYLIGVVWYAVKAEPRPEEPAVVREENRPGPRPPEATTSRLRPDRSRPDRRPPRRPTGPRTASARAERSR
jgi:hypothetical protein